MTGFWNRLGNLARGGFASRQVEADDFVGKWKLVRVDQGSPAAMSIKLLHMTVTEDGKWTFFSEMQGKWEGTSIHGGGTWSLANDVIAYTSGGTSGTTRIGVRTGVLVLDPDFTLRKGGAVAVVAEYEREIGDPAAA